MTWLACFAAAVVPPWIVWRRCPERALGASVLLSMATPTWLYVEVAGLPAHLRFAAALASVCLYCVHPRATVSFRLGPVDLAGLSLLAAGLASDVWNQGPSLEVPTQAYGEWFLPYVAGRLAVRSLADARSLLPVAAAVSILLAAAAIAECVFRWDVYGDLFGGPAAGAPPPLDSARPDSVRWGVKRACGPTMNPTYFGPLQLLLLPWALYAAARARVFAAPGWWRLAPWISAAGLVATASRGAVIGLAAVLLIRAGLLRPRVRVALAAGLAVAALFAALRPGPLVDLMVAWGGERRLEEQPRVEVDGELVPRSNTLYRAYLFSVYRVAAERAGALGFGTEAVTGFPVNVPLGPVDPVTARFLRYLDNAYLLVLLRFGLIGLISFVLLGVTAAASYARRALPPAAPGRAFHAGMAAAIAATMLLMLGVWMPFDFGFLFLWTVGTASGLSAARAADDGVLD